MTPELTTKEPTKPFAADVPLYRHRDTKEYCIRLKRPGKKDAWVSLGTTDRTEALRRLRDTGVEKILQVAGDEKFTEAIVESLTAGDRVPLEDVVDQYLKDLALKIHRGSMGHHRTILTQLMRMFKPGVDVREIPAEKVAAFINTAPSLPRRRRRLSVTEQFFTYAFEQGKRKDIPTKRVALKLDDLTFEQMERTIKERWTQAEYDQLLACEKIQGFWRYAIQLGWWLGLRLSDVCCLQWGSFCAEPGKLVVWQRKTRVRVSLDLNDPVLGGGVLIKVFAEMKENVTDATYCFPAWRELYESSNSPAVGYAFKDVCRAAGFDARKTFHCLRKSAALRWQEAGRDLKEIGALLGHEGLSSTTTYLETKR